MVGPDIVGMKRVVDFILFLVFCALVGTGIGMELLHGKNELHFPLGIIFIVLVICHLLLNRKWIATVLARDNKLKLVGGILLGLALLLFLMFFTTTERRRGPGQGQGPMSGLAERDPSR